MYVPDSDDCIEVYNLGQVCELIRRAQLMGFSLEPGSPLEALTIEELQHLVAGANHA